MTMKHNNNNVYVDLYNAYTLTNL